jgi:hypothetical protein
MPEVQCRHKKGSPSESGGASLLLPHKKGFVFGKNISIKGIKVLFYQIKHSFRFARIAPVFDLPSQNRKNRLVFQSWNHFKMS